MKLNRSRISLRNNKIQNSLFIVTLGIVLLLASLLFVLPGLSSKKSNAEQTPNVTEGTLNISIAVPGSIDVSLEPSAQGSFSSASVKAIVNTNNYTGYNLSLSTSGSSGSNTDLINSTDKTSTLKSISGTVSQTNFSAASGTSYNNKYGFSTDAANVSNKSFRAIPTVNSQGITIDNTSTSGQGDTDLTIGARVNNSLPAGNYTNGDNYTLTLSALANEYNYVLTYNKDTTDAVSNMPSPNPVSGTLTGSSYTTSNKTPTRTGYTFMGWCSKAITNNSTANPSCPGTTYQPNTTYDDFFDVSVQNTNVNIYAIWKVNSHTLTINPNGGSFNGTTANTTITQNYNTSYNVLKYP